MTEKFQDAVDSIVAVDALQGCALFHRVYGLTCCTDERAA